MAWPFDWNPREAFIEYVSSYTSPSDLAQMERHEGHDFPRPSSPTETEHVGTNVFDSSEPARARRKGYLDTVVQQVSCCESRAFCEAREPHVYPFVDQTLTCPMGRSLGKKTKLRPRNATMMWISQCHHLPPVPFLCSMSRLLSQLPINVQNLP